MNADWSLSSGGKEFVGLQNTTVGLYKYKIRNAKYNSRISGDQQCKRFTIVAIARDPKRQMHERTCFNEMLNGFGKEGSGMALFNLRFCMMIRLGLL